MTAGTAAAAGRLVPRIGSGSGPLGGAQDIVARTDLAIVPAPQRQHSNIVAWWIIPNEFTHDIR
jgi:hypothetical protein